MGERRFTVKEPVLLPGRERNMVDYEPKRGCRIVCLGDLSFFHAIYVYLKI